MDWFLTFDIGTTSVKTCLFDEDLKQVCESNEEYELIAGSGTIELEAQTYWQAVQNGVRSVTHGRQGRVVSITATTQGETMIPVDKQGNALRNAIVWLDGRAEKEAGQIRQAVGDDTFYQTTGLPDADGCCPVSKLVWIKNNEPDVYAKTHKFLLLEDYIIFRLSGRYVSEKSLLSSTGYFDIVRDEYWHDILQRMGIDEEKLPQALECGEAVGRILPEVAGDLGISQEAVVTTGAMDQFAAAVGAGNTAPGTVTESTGTALVIGATTGKLDGSHPSRSIIYRHVTKGNYMILPICMTAGIVLKWFKDEFCKLETAQCEKEGKPVYGLLSELAAKVPPLSDGLTVFPHFTGMLMPQKDLKAKGVFLGVGLDTKLPHFVRAIFEAVAYMLRENIEVVEEYGVNVPEIRSLGGGAKSDVWMQIKADVTGKDIVCMDENEAASLGAAILGGVALGRLKSLAEGYEKGNGIRKRFVPNAENKALYDKGFEKYRQLYESVKTLF